MKQGTSRIAVIGDLVNSRKTADRQALHTAVEAALARTNEVVASVDPAIITVGDEFQGVYASLGEALQATFLIRARLHLVTGVRFGLGRGAVQTLDPVRGIHDGPAYWAARAAIVRAEDRSRHAQSRTSRTAFVSDEDDPALVSSVQSALDCLDFMVGSMSAKSRVILEGLMDGQSQQDIAQTLGISASAVSQRAQRDGIGLALDVMTTLGELP